MQTNHRVFLRMRGVYPKIQTSRELRHIHTSEYNIWCFESNPIFLKSTKLSRIFRADLFVLTCFLNVCAFLVHGGAQRGRAHVQHANLIHTGVKHPQRVLLLLIVMTEDLTVDEGGKHLRLQET